MNDCGCDSSCFFILKAILNLGQSWKNLSRRQSYYCPKSTVQGSDNNGNAVSLFCHPHYYESIFYSILGNIWVSWWLGLWNNLYDHIKYIVCKALFKKKFYEFRVYEFTETVDLKLLKPDLWPLKQIVKGDVLYHAFFWVDIYNLGLCCNIFAWFKV